MKTLMIITCVLVIGLYSIKLFSKDTPASNDEQKPQSSEQSPSSSADNQQESITAYVIPYPGAQPVAIVIKGLNLKQIQQPVQNSQIPPVQQNQGIPANPYTNQQNYNPNYQMPMHPQNMYSQQQAPAPAQQQKNPQDLTALFTQQKPLIQNPITQQYDEINNTILMLAKQTQLLTQYIQMTTKNIQDSEKLLTDQMDWLQKSNVTMTKILDQVKQLKPQQKQNIETYNKSMDKVLASIKELAETYNKMTNPLAFTDDKVKNAIQQLENTKIEKKLAPTAPKNQQFPPIPNDEIKKIEENKKADDLQKDKDLSSTNIKPSVADEVVKQTSLEKKDTSLTSTSDNKQVSSTNNQALTILTGDKKDKPDTKDGSKNESFEYSLDISKLSLDTIHYILIGFLTFFLLITLILLISRRELSKKIKIINKEK